MPWTADRVKETTAVTGTGAATLLGATTQFQSFQTAFPLAPLDVAYAIVGQSGNEWEVGRGLFTAPSTLSRDTVEYSSNANALVNFSAGTKDVFASFTGPFAMNANPGLSMPMAQHMGWN
jgi:hypothetical protein